MLFDTKPTILMASVVTEPFSLLHSLYNTTSMVLWEILNQLQDQQKGVAINSPVIHMPNIWSYHQACLDSYNARMNNLWQLLLLSWEWFVTDEMDSS